MLSLIEGAGGFYAGVAAATWFGWGAAGRGSTSGRCRETGRSSSAAVLVCGGTEVVRSMYIPFLLDLEGDIRGL